MSERRKSTIIKSITIEEVSFMTIDLTEPLKENVQVYPGDPKPKKKVFSEIGKTGYQHHIYSLGDHVFHPHVDAPKHQNPELQYLLSTANFDLEDYFHTACLIDLSEVGDTQEFDGIRFLTKVTKEHLYPFNLFFLSKREAVLIRTGYDRWLETNRPHNPKNLPYLDKTAAEYITSFGNIKAVGIDSLTIDPAGSHKSHQLLKDRMIIESLVHLHAIPIERREKFTLMTMPIRIVGATGGPVAALAFI